MTVEKIELTVLTVASCGDCPMFQDHCFCRHPEKPDEASFFDDGDESDPLEQPPTWCPLRARPFQIQIEEGQ